MLGPFVLNAPLGQGGMAVVWEGQHATRGVPVAIKIMKGSRADRDARHMFRAEVRAVASLDHPNVVRVLDVGELPPSVVAQGLEPGAPYLVMERAHGTLKRPSTATGLRSVLLQLLDALAHAHARGIVHLDLKASNVLVGGTRPGVRLSDFGLARAWRGAGETPRGGSRGTPSHMALEQLEGGEVGPWTDLYALGVLAWRLATGQRPYKASSVLEAAVAMTRSLPDFRPDLPVPPGFEAWVRGLMQRDPSQRYRRAADAAWALLQLGPTDAWRADGPAAAATEVEPAPDAVTLIFDTVAPAAPRTRDHGALRPHPAPLPAYVPSAMGPVDELRGTGVGLFALRDIGLVGRTTAERWLWRHLREAAQQRAPRCVAIDGAPGAGASRLARWLCERAHELGAGEVLAARHGPAPEPGHGLGPMLASAFRLTGRPPHEVRARLHEAGIDATDAAALAAVIAPAEAARPVRSAAERHRLVLRALRALGARRPLVLWLDDVHHDPDSLAFARHLRDTGAGLAVLIVLTGAPPSDVPPEHRLRLPVLDDSAIDALVRRALGVDDEVRQAVVTAAAGAPLLAMQALSLLVDARRLRAGPDGLRASRSALADLPSTPAAAFRARVRAVAPDSIEALRLAALLGHHVPIAEWRAGCHQLGLSLHDGDIDRLLGAGLLRGVDGGLAFAHQAMRRGLDDLPTATRRHWHLTLAGVVDEPERQAHHLLAAGDAPGALGPLDQAAALATERGQPQRAEALWRRQLDALTAAGADDGDPRRSRVLLQLARSLRVRGAWDEAADNARTLLHEARTHGWARQVANALVELAMDRQNAGDLAAARHTLREAYDASRPRSSSRAAAALRLSLLAIDAGDSDGARSMAEEALDFYAAPGAQPRSDLHWNDDIGAGYAHVVIGRTQLRQGDTTRGLRHLDRAAERFAHAGDRLAIADALNYRAGALLSLGRVDEAEVPFRQALAHYEALGAWSAVLVRVNLAVLAIDAGRVDEARAPLEAALRQLDTEGRHAFAAAVRVFLLPCFLAAEEQGRFEQAATHAQSALDQSGFVDPDLLRVAERSLRGATARGWSTSDLQDLVEAQQRGLG